MGVSASKKVSKAKKPVKALKPVNAKTAIFNGAATGGKNRRTRLRKADLTKNRNGRVVSKKASAASKKNPWIAACNAARKALGVKGFVAIKKGSALYKKAQS